MINKKQKLSTFFVLVLFACGLAGCAKSNEVGLDDVENQQVIIADRDEVLQTWEQEYESANTNQEKALATQHALDMLQNVVVSKQDQEMHLQLVLKLSQLHKLLNEDKDSDAVVLFQELKKL